MKFLFLQSVQLVLLTKLSDSATGTLSLSTLEKDANIKDFYKKLLVYRGLHVGISRYINVKILLCIFTQAFNKFNNPKCFLISNVFHV